MFCSVADFLGISMAVRSADRILSGQPIAGSQFLDGDGRFPNHIPNPENADAMAAGRNMVTTRCRVFSFPHVYSPCAPVTRSICPRNSPVKGIQMLSPRDFRN